MQDVNQQELSQDAKNMVRTKIFTSSLIVTALTLTGCASGDQYKANVYRQGQVNQAQAAKMVQIMAINPAKIEVDNSQGKQAAQIGGAIIGALLGGAAGNRSNNTGVGALAGGVAGAAAGTMVSDKTLVDGVQLTYVENNRMLSSAQVGKMCEFKLGTALVISTGYSTETRIQPNNDVPCP